MNEVGCSDQRRLGKSYYSFESYVTLERMVTYWYQIKETLSLNPKRVLEIGKGSGIVESSCRAFGLNVETADINEQLNPDHVLSVLDAGEAFMANPYDLILCARVLHHVPFEDFRKALESLSKAGKYTVLTLPVDDLRIYISFRATSKRSIVFSVPFPLSVKRMYLKFSGKDKTYYANLWKIGSSKETQLDQIKSTISCFFEVVQDYSIREDKSHHIFVLRSRRL